MLRRKHIKNRSAASVSGGSTAVIPLVIGKTYHQVNLTLAGDLTVAKIDAIRVVRNGEVLDSWKSGTQLQSLNSFKKLSSSTTFLQIPFNRKGLLSIDHQELIALGTGLETDPDYTSTLHIEIDINASSATPSISSYSVVSDASPLNFVRMTRHFTYDQIAAGDFEIPDLPRGYAIDKIFIKSYLTATPATAVNVQSVKLKLDEEEVWNRTMAENEAMQDDGGVRTHQAGYFVIDTTENGDGGEYIETANRNAMLLTITNSTAATSHLVTVEYLGRAPKVN